MKITYQYEKEGVNWEEVAAILRRAHLEDKPAKVQETIFANSYAAVFAYDGERIVGVARALSDGVCQGAIYNVAVEEEYRGYGIGKRLIAGLLSRLKGQNVILYTHPKNISLYEHLGFRRAKSAMEYFDIGSDHKQWMEANGFFLPERFRFCDEYGREDMVYKKPVRKKGLIEEDCRE